MKRYKISIDPNVQLPERETLPYWLWFHFLKLALHEKRVRVDRHYYRDWGDINNIDFDQWWSHIGSDLFHETEKIQIINTEHELETATQHEDVVVRIEHGVTLRSLIKSITSIHRSYLLGRTKTEVHNNTSKFKISSNGNIRYSSLLSILTSIELRRNCSSLEELMIAHYQWYCSMKERHDPENISRLFFHLPAFIPSFIEEIHSHQKNTHSRFKFTRRSHRYNELRSQAMRFVRKGDKLLQNVADGVFPGDY